MRGRRPLKLRLFEGFWGRVDVCTAHIVKPTVSKIGKAGKDAGARLTNVH